MVCVGKCGPSRGVVGVNRQVQAQAAGSRTQPTMVNNGNKKGVGQARGGARQAGNAKVRQ